MLRGNLIYFGQRLETPHIPYIICPTRPKQAAHFLRGAVGTGRAFGPNRARTWTRTGKTFSNATRSSLQNSLKRTIHDSMFVLCPHKSLRVHQGEENKRTHIQKNTLEKNKYTPELKRVLPYLVFVKHAGISIAKFESTFATLYAGLFTLIGPNYSDLSSCST